MLYDAYDITKLHMVSKEVSGTQHSHRSDLILAKKLFSNVRFEKRVV